MGGECQCGGPGKVPEPVWNLWLHLVVMTSQVFSQFPWQRKYANVVLQGELPQQVSTRNQLLG